MILRMLGNPIQDILLTLALFLPMLVLAFTVHELCHGLTAYRLGDSTAKSQGRLTLNPLKHIDPVGFLFILIVGFGWAKPVMVNPYNLKNPKVDMALIAAAGPISNFLLAFIASMLLMVFASERFMLLPDGGIGYLPNVPIRAIMFFIQINLMLGIFNLLPIPPLDGSKILAGIIPQKTLNRLPDISRYSLVILLILILPIFSGSSIIGLVILPMVEGLFVLFINVGLRFFG